MKCGLLGQTLGHSYSPQIHSQLGSYSYELFEKQPQELEDFIKNGDYVGLNVTVPYKKEVIPYLTYLTPIAEHIGAVNTIVREGDRFIGHNTDFYGFQKMVDKSGLDVRNKKVLVLGSGGASNAVMAALINYGAKPVVISRRGPNNYKNLHLHADAAIIVNTTPVGMFPNVGRSPIDLNLFPQLEGVLDVIYNPANTQLLMDAQQRGLVTMNGLWMLVAQAKQSAEWFLGYTIDDYLIRTIHAGLRLQMENIILVGMPGSGKSTIGKLLAKALGKKFVDADTAVANSAKMSIPEIFAQQGEDAFRAMETRVLKRLGKRSGLVIATGGGCVTREENYPLLHQNGIILYLDRHYSYLPTEGRPLSQRRSLKEMYTIRKPMYERFADYRINGNQEPQAVVRQILRTLEVSP